MAVLNKGLVALLGILVITLNLGANFYPLLLANGEQMKLSSILPKLNSMHEDTKSLLIKNFELKDKIVSGMKARAESRLTLSKVNNQTEIQSGRIPSSNISSSLPTNYSSIQQQQQHTIQSPLAIMTRYQEANNSSESLKSQNIDYEELEAFNEWVETNLEYAVENTFASAEELKEEARQNNGTVDFTVEALNDGIEGVKYWQSAVEFQDKTLKNEKFDKVI